MDHNVGQEKIPTIPVDVFSRDLPLPD